MVRRPAVAVAFALLLLALLVAVSIPGLREAPPNRHAPAAKLSMTRGGRVAGGAVGSRVFADRDLLTEPDGVPVEPAPPLPVLARAAKASAVTVSVERSAPWSPDRLLADPTHMNDEHLALAVSPLSGCLFAVWSAYDLGGTDRDIHIARSDDGGGTWTQHEMPSSSLDESMPDLACDDAGYVHVVWVRDDGVLVRARSAGPEDTANWAFVQGFEVGEPVAVPSIAVSGSGDFARVVVACSWYTVNPAWYQHEYTLLWLFSTNGGQTVAYDYLQPDGYADLWPDVALSGATAFLVNGEQDPSTGRIRILAAADALSGTFTDYVDLTQTSSMSHGFPAVVADGDNVYVAWQLDWDDGLGNIDGDVMYAFSWDGMASVYGPYEIMATTSESVGPTLLTRDGVVGCFWLEAPASGDDFDLAARLASLDGHPDFWGDMETVTDQAMVVPQFRAAAGGVGPDGIVAAWIDRRDFNLQGYNVYTSDRDLLPDLAPFTPDGWQSPLVVSMTAGAREDGVVAVGFPAFASLAVVNLGLADATAPVSTELWLDETLVGAWVLADGLPQATFSTAEDVPLTLTAGAHTLILRIDPDDRVAEADETDNVLTRELWVVSGEPCLVLSPTSLRFDAYPPAASPPLVRRVADPVIAPRLADAFLGKGADARLRVVVTPAERLDPVGLQAMSRRAALQELRDRAATVAAGLQTRAGADLRALWLSGELVGELTADEVDDLAASPEVGRLWLDDRRSEMFDEPTRPSLAWLPMGEATRAPWPLEMLGVPAVWARGLDGSGILVGHTDSGVAWDHPDLADHLWDGGAEFPHHGYDFIDEDDDPYDPGDGDFWHGTHTAGLIVGTSYGAAPGARLLETRCVPGYYEDLVEALQFCLDHGCDLISSSAGWTAPDDALRSANRGNAEILLSLGVPWIVAAGNGDNLGGHLAVPDDISSPGDAPDPWYGDAGHTAVITVGALTETRQVWYASSLGPADWSVAGDASHDDYPYPPGLTKPDLAAPGADVVSTIGGGGYAAYSGTSMATPLVAGCAALLLQANPALTPAELAAALETTATDLDPAGRDNQSGAGLVDVPAALDAVPSSQATVVLIRNTGVVPLVLDAIDVTADWLTASASATTVAPDDSVRLTVNWDAGGLGAGGYFTDIVLRSNDPRGPAHLPVALVVGDVVGVDEALPQRPGPLTCYPNPFNPRTTLHFRLRDAGAVTLQLFDTRGRLVRTLIRHDLAAGEHDVPWDGRAHDGRSCAAGVYLARLESSGGIRTGRLLLVK